MNIYRALYLNRVIKNHRLKFFGLWVLHKFKGRYLSVNFDPVMACNLKCQMCYFSDPDYVRRTKGIFKKEDLPFLGKAILKRALKFQIGCGTEPTMYKHLVDVVRLGKKYKVPFISLTTNANELSSTQISKLAEAGLDEFTISLHGVYEKEYEFFMRNASYSKFLDAIAAISEAKKTYPSLKLRVNYTFNHDNLLSLKDFFKIFGGYSIDYLQIRPIKKIGNSEYDKFDISELKDKYNHIIKMLSQECNNRGISLLAVENFESLADYNYSSLIADYTYCYISPNHFWRDGFDYKNETFDAFSKRTKWSISLLQNVFKSKRSLNESKEFLNYDVI